MPQHAQSAGCGRPANPFEMYLVSMKTMMEWSPVAPMLGLRWRLGEYTSASFAAMGVPAAVTKPLEATLEATAAPVKPVEEAAAPVESEPEAVESVAVESEPADTGAEDTPAPTVAEVLSASVAEGVADDLTMISGVGPATARALNEAGIFTFAQLAALSVEDLMELRRSIGPAISAAVARAQIAEAGNFAEA